MINFTNLCESILGSEQRRIIKFAVLGLFANTIGFSLYAAMVWLGLAPVLTVTILTPVYLAALFVVQQKYVFRTSDYRISSYFRFIKNYVFVYLANISLLHLMVEILNYDAFISQAILIILLGIIAYLLSKKLFQKK